MSDDEDPCAECLTCQTKMIGSLINGPMHTLLVSMAAGAVSHYVRVGVMTPTVRDELSGVIGATLHFLETLDEDQYDMIVALLGNEGFHFQPIEGDS